jgi:hypothetical protein
MSVRWTVNLLVCAVPCVAGLPVAAQDATVTPVSAEVLAPPLPVATRHGKVRAVYDSTADSTRWTLVTHKGRYFLTIQRPRLTWTGARHGREPGEPAATVQLEFRTQEPQVALDSRLLIHSAAGAQVEVGSSGSYSDPGVVTWSHFMRFEVPCDELARVLVSDEATVVVGGIRERLKPDHVRALRYLLDRLGAWPPQ